MARPPAGKEVAAGTGKTGGMYHWAKGRDWALPPQAEQGGWTGVFRIVLPEVTWGKWKILPECKLEPSVLDRTRWSSRAEPH